MANSDQDSITSSAFAAGRNFNVTVVSTSYRVTAEEYLAAVREHCQNLPYLTLHGIRPLKTLDEVYAPLTARSLPPKDEGKPKEEQEPMRLSGKNGAPSMHTENPIRRSLISAMKSLPTEL